MADGYSSAEAVPFGWMWSKIEKGDKGMKLAQLFSGETHSDNVVRSQMTPAQIENMNRQIRSLAPGQTISGEIVSRNGSEVQIRLTDDMILNARIDRDLNIEVGKNMTFEVKNNGSALTLSPLFTNVSTDRNVLKALDMAGLPANETTVAMTQQLMAAALPVNKNILQQIYREINSFPESQIADVINLHKLQMPVNEANINQMASYRNLTHQMIQGVDTILEALPEVFDSMVAEGDVPGAVKLYQELFLLTEGGQADSFEGGSLIGDSSMEMAGAVSLESLQEGDSQTQGTPEAGKSLTETAQSAESGALGANDSLKGLAGAGEGNRAAEMSRTVEAFSGEQGSTVPLGEEQKGEGSHAVFREETASPAAENETITESARRTMARDAMRLVESLRLPPEETQSHRAQIIGFARGEVSAKAFFSQLELLARQSMAGSDTTHALQAWGRLFSRQSFKEILTGRLRDNWTVRPEELENPGRVDELYRRMDRQLKSLAGVLEDAGQSGTNAFRAASSMSQNIDFLQQVNQMYTYVQLPIKLQQGEAHGELYVYANKKKLTRSDGAVSALLHLDMDHLGPVDVYVALQGNRVNTKFYLRDEEMIDFLAGHMDVLTRRLNGRGYDCSFAMNVRGQETQKAGGLEPLLAQEKGIMLSQYAFDVRT